MDVRATRATIAVNRYHTPPERVMELLRSPVILAGGLADLPALPRPAIIVGGNPCIRFASAVGAEQEVVYVLVSGSDGSGELADAVLGIDAGLDAIVAAGARALREKRRDGRPRPIVGREGFAWRGQQVELSELEVRIVRRLVAAQGAVVDKQALAYEIWGNYFCDPGRAVDTHIYRIRKRIQPMAGVELVTERQHGFRLITR